MLLNHFRRERTVRFSPCDKDDRLSDSSEDTFTSSRYEDMRTTIRHLQLLVFGLSMILVATATLLYCKTIGPEKVIKPLVPSTVLIPKFPRQAKTFIENEIYSSPPSNKSNAAWDSLVPRGRGWINIANWEKYGLKQGVDNNLEDGSKKYVLSVFHQLHCLDMLRVGYFSALKNGTEDVMSNTEHLQHCFDYLRQSVMCAGDTTIEEPMIDEDGERTGSNGYDITHECVNFEALYQWTDQHRADDGEGIL